MILKIALLFTIIYTIIHFYMFFSKYENYNTQIVSPIGASCSTAGNPNCQGALALQNILIKQQKMDSLLRT